MHYTRENTRFVSSGLITLRTNRKHSWCMRLRVCMYVCTDDATHLVPQRVFGAVLLMKSSSAGNLESISPL